MWAPYPVCFLGKPHFWSDGCSTFVLFLFGPATTWLTLKLHGPPEITLPPRCDAGRSPQRRLNHSPIAMHLITDGLFSSTEALIQHYQVCRRAMFPVLTCLDLLRCMGLVMPTSKWTRLSRFGILDTEHAERSYASCVLIDLQLRNSVTWRTGGCLHCCWRRLESLPDCGLGIVCRYMTNDHVEWENTDVYWLREGQTATNLLFCRSCLFKAANGSDLLWDFGDVRQEIKCASATEYSYYTCYTFYICYTHYIARIQTMTADTYPILWRINRPGLNHLWRGVY